jgi:hypothetical protein
MTEELRRRVKSLEAKLEETKSTLKRKASTSRDTATLHKKKAKNAEGDGKKSNKTPGNAVARSTVIPNKNKKWKRTATTTPTTTTTKKLLGTPAGNDGASTNTNKRKATGYKSGGKRGGKPTAANN